MNISLLSVMFSHLWLKISKLLFSCLQIFPIKLITVETAVIDSRCFRCVYCSVAPLASYFAISFSLPTSWTYAHWSWMAVQEDWFRDELVCKYPTASLNNRRNSIDVSTEEANTNTILFCYGSEQGFSFLLRIIVFQFLILLPCSKQNYTYCKIK